MRDSKWRPKNGANTIHFLNVLSSFVMLLNDSVFSLYLDSATLIANFNFSKALNDIQAMPWKLCTLKKRKLTEVILALLITVVLTV